MRNRKLAGATALSLALPGLIASLAVMPAANANIESDTGSDTQTSGDTIRSDATMEQQCKWVLVGAPSSMTLTPTTAGEEYNGNALTLSDDLSSDISVHSTGNLDTSAVKGQPKTQVSSKKTTSTQSNSNKPAAKNNQK